MNWIELSIVLIVISLVVAGIVGGKSLIHSAELQSIITEVNKYKTSYNNFRLQYDAILGDMPNATDYWPADCVNAGSNTCNGNNNDYIGDVVAGGSEEPLRAWQHFGLSEMILGKYTGLEYSSPDSKIPDSKIGINVLASKLKVSGDYGTAGYELSYFTSNGLYGIQANFLWLSTEFPSKLFAPALSPVDAKSIDKKIDDGKPTKGKALSRSNFIPLNCVTASNEYNVARTDIQCSMFFRVD